MFNFDMMCISETYLDPSFTHDDCWLNLRGYIVVRAGKPNNTKRDSALKEPLTISSLASLCFLLEVFSQNRKDY